MSGWGLRDIGENISVSHEAVRIWLMKLYPLMKGFYAPLKRRDIIALDETKIYLEGMLIFVWAAIDIETKELLGIKVSRSRSSRIASDFIHEVLSRCENEPFFFSDNAPWLSEPLKRMGLKFKKERFGKRGVVERFFRTLKQRIRKFFGQISEKGIEVFCILFSFFYNFVQMHQEIKRPPCLLQEVLS